MTTIENVPTHRLGDVIAALHAGGITDITVMPKGSDATLWTITLN